MGAHHVGLEENDGESSSPISTSFLIHKESNYNASQLLKGLNSENLS